jgi:hypothetical protein
MTKKEQWYIDNKEQIKQKAKQYYQNNKDKRLAYAKQRGNNKEYVNQWMKSHKLDYHIVYLLPDYNYVGVTDNPYVRMSVHKCEENRNTSNWIELARYVDRQEALTHEARLHAEGYEGANACYNITQEA